MPDYTPLARWLGRAGTLEERPRLLAAADENFHRTLLVTHYPTDLPEGAMAALLGLRFPVRAAAAVAPADFAFDRWAHAKLRRLEATVEERASEVGGVVLESEAGAAEALRHFRTQRVVGDLWLTVTVSAATEQDLEERCRQVQAVLQREGCAVAWLGKEQEPGFLHGFAIGDPAPLRAAHRGWLADPASAATAWHPAVSGTLDDGRGVYFGHRIEDGSRVALDLGAGVHNRNAVVLGASGEGKSTLLKALTAGMLAEGWRLFVFDVDGEYRPLCEAAGGVWIDQSAATGAFFDPLLAGGASAQAAALAALGVLAEGMDAEERAAADMAVSGAGSLREAYALLQSGDGAGRRLAYKLRPFFEGTLHGLFASEEADLPDAALTVIHVGQSRRGGGENTAQAVRMFLATHHVWLEVRRERERGRRHTAVIFEEGQRLLQDEAMSAFVLDVATAIRKFNGLCVLALNDPAVLFSTAGGEGLWQNSAVKVLFWLEEAGLRAVAEHARIPPEVLDVVASLQGSHCFAVRYAERGWDVLRLLLPPEETALYRTRGGGGA